MRSLKYIAEVYVHPVIITGMEKPITVFVFLKFTKELITPQRERAGVFILIVSTTNCSCGNFKSF